MILIIFVKINYNLICLGNVEIMKLLKFRSTTNNSNQY